MHLDYRLNEDAESDWSAASEEDLRYRLALGNLILRVGDKDFSADWGWIPLIDLAASFAEIVRKLESGSAREKFEFTESDAWIGFERKGDKVLVSSSYGDATGQTSLPSLAEAMQSFRERLRVDLAEKHPEATRNAPFRSLLGPAERTG